MLGDYSSDAAEPFVSYKGARRRMHVTHVRPVNLDHNCRIALAFDWAKLK